MGARRIGIIGRLLWVFYIGVYYSWLSLLEQFFSVNFQVIGKRRRETKMSTDWVNDYAAPWVFIIDTDEYAGNFEREMCAYCTGMIGQCEVGEEMATLFEEDFELEADNYGEDNPFMDYMDLWVMDDHGCGRPTSIWRSPSGDGCNSVAIFFQQEPTEEHIKIMKERAQNFASERPDGKKYSVIELKPKPFNVLGFRMLKQVVTTTETTV